METKSVAGLLIDEFDRILRKKVMILEDALCEDKGIYFTIDDKYT